MAKEQRGLRQVVLGAAAVVVLMAHMNAQAAVLATVGKKQLTDQDLKGALSQFNDGQRGNILKDPQNRRQILLGMIEQEVLIQEAERQKLGEDEKLKAAVDAFRKQQMVAMLMDKNLSSRLTEAAAKKFYDQNKILFSTDQVRAQHILVQTDAEAREVLKKSREANADFQKLAETLSRDPSAKNNRGELGYFTRDQLAEEFTKAAFRASPGDIVGPIKTTYGYHIIKVMDKKVGKIQGYDEVELKVRGMLRQRMASEYISKIREQSEVKLDEAAIEKF